MLISITYSLVRVLLDAINSSHTDRAKLEAEVLALRQQVKVLERAPPPNVTTLSWRWRWRKQIQTCRALRSEESQRSPGRPALFSDV